MPDWTDVADLVDLPHSPLRSVLACRPPPPEVDVAAAVEFFRTESMRDAYWGWRGGKAPPARYLAGGGQFWVDDEVWHMRWRSHVEEARRRAHAIARRDGLWEPAPPMSYVVDDQAYGSRCLAAAARAGRPAPAMARGGRDAVHAYGVDVRRRWEAAYAESDEGCPYASGMGWKECPCARTMLPPCGPYFAFWSLIADMRPIVVAVESGCLIDGARRLSFHAALGARSPGVPVERRAYGGEQAEREAIVALNAGNPAMPPIERVRLAEAMRPYYRREAARNCGRARYEVPEWSSGLPAVGRRGAPREPPRPRRVNDRLAALAAMRRPTYERHLARLSAPVAEGAVTAA